MDKVRDLADKIFSGDYANSGDMFKNIMQDKISEKLDEMTPVLFAEAAEKNKEEKKISKVEVRFDRHVRAHGKNPNVGADAFWAFTHKDKGHVDHKNEKEIYHVNGKFSDAKKTAIDWAKKHGHETIYVME